MLEKYYNSRKDNTDLNVYRCGFEECSKGHSWGPGVRDHYIIHVILSGKGSFTLNGNTCHLEQGKGFLICPGQIVHYEADIITPWTYSWVGFHGLKADTVLKKAGLSVHNPLFDFSNSDSIVKVLNDMIIAARNDTVSDLMLTGYLYLFLADLIYIRKSRETVNDGLISSDRYVSKAIEYIEKNYSASLSVNHLARNLKIDRSYLSTLFTRYLGLSPRDFIIHFRIDKACELLKNPLLSIGDVARSVGYEDPLQFSKTFRKAKGDSPKHYRKTVLSL